ncbi:MAG: hypothetical protein ACE5DI_04990, partial [Candidatus Micrarchaeia archaeon]
APELLESLRIQRPKWKIEVSQKNASVQCNCGFSGRPKITEKAHDLVLFECAKCGNTPKATSGNKIILKKVSVE